MRSLELTEREKIVLQMRADGYIRRVIAEKLGVTPERIRQIEAKALEKLRESAEK